MVSSHTFAPKLRSIQMLIQIGGVSILMILISFAISANIHKLTEGNFNINIENKP